MGEVRTVGVEEEFLVVDPDTGQVVDQAAAVLRQAAPSDDGDHPGDDDGPLDLELLQHQLETRTEPATDLGMTLDQLVNTRRSLGEAARSAGLAVVATGTSPLPVDDAGVTPKDRYRVMVEEFGEIGRAAGTCGMHVHVGIASREEGVAIVDRLRPWLPVVLALSVNSPYADGRDTGYASWRAHVWSRWPTAGPTEPFGDPETYDRVVDELVASGAARDLGMLYFDARLAAQQPTVEVRVADVCTDPAFAVTIAAVVRALATTAAEAWQRDEPTPVVRTELLRASAWRASRYGLAETLVHPLEGGLAPARRVLEALVDLAGDALQAAGDLDRVTAGFDQLLASTGASRQRAAFERSGAVEGVVADLVERSEKVWTAG